MAKKDENLKRLKELSELLGREPDMSGSAADIAQRVAELEEELGGVDGTDNQASVLTGQENNGEAVPPERMIQNTDEDDWQAVLHIAVFVRAQAPDSELDTWMENTIFPAMKDIPVLSGLIDTMIPLGFNYQRDNEMATWAMAEITYQITYTN
ncbi:hypothetical protein GJ354_21400 [Shigella dysenteriae]|uniref:phage tail terminator protein n=1 Tax=Shigella dysenteriae TaxID=622 RepID=UPI001070C673|nr:phage tail terminator protein [Shigella dysenteriae]EFV8088119.1 hypothetical protein [Shigella dysenteriae]EFW7981193.1 hypothetical protein [Shigella dysenteriae]EFX6676379.1 hypothetical protein [Shigella dysenteriae]EFY9877229.1 hypothetical protein [Shigella dysenteriae]EFY9902370.1 hypothetical protein [Shigella dysenteriae]